MNIFEKFRKRIEDFLKKEKVKQLPLTSNEEYKKSVSNYFTKSLNCIIPKQPNICLEDAIDMWLNNYIELMNNEKKGTNAYNALVSINASKPTEKEKTENINNEKKLIHSLSKRKNIFTVPQGERQSNYFLNIFSANQFDCEHNTTHRLYINCDNSKTAKIANEILKRIDENEKFHFKILTSDVEEPRTEKIVIYLSGKEDINNMISKIEDIKEKNSDLFKNSKENPFMKNYLGFVGIGNEPKNEQFKHIDGRITNEILSYNNFLSIALEDSLKDTVNQVISHDYNLNDSIKEIGKITPDVYKIIKDNYRDFFYKNMVDKTLKSTKMNGLEIQENHHQEINGIKKNENIKNMQQNEYEHDR